MEKFNLDEILMEIGGWGRFQKQTLFFLCLVAIFSVFHLSYIFIARDTQYRCFINNCDNTENSIYNPDWLVNAVPFKDNIPSRCSYYEIIETTNNSCTNFNHSSIHLCHTFVYERKQTTIANDFNIICDENLWKLTIVGTINALGSLVCLSFVGFISDRFGRKFLIIASVLSSTIIGFLKSLSISYTMYVSLEFLDATLCSGMYSASFILAMELVSSEKRGLANTLLSCAFSIGQVILGLVAWLTPSWRIMLRMLYIPGLLITVLLWFIPESVRWLISKRNKRKAKQVLENVAKLNKKNLSEDAIKCLSSNTENVHENPNREPFCVFFRSKKLFFRTVLCSFTWVCCVFPYYGLTIHSVGLSNDIYMNFITTSIVEIPAYILTSFLIDKYGRRLTLSITLIFAGISCILVNFPEPDNWLALFAFLCGKFFITISYTTLYIFTAEMFPTSSRHTSFAICSMFGRLGSMLAPQVPLLARLFKSLPLIIFAMMAATAGFMSFLFPETHNIKLPDQINEAEHIQEACKSI